MEKILERHGERIPEHVRILDVGWDEKKCQSTITLECDYHGVDVVRPYYVNKTDYFCRHCGTSVRGYPEHRIQSLLAANKKGRLTQLGVMTVEVEGIRGLKVGVSTRSLEQRYLWYLKQIHHSVRLYEIEAYTLENRIKNEFSQYRDDRILKHGMRSGKRWGGDTEIFANRKKSEIIQFIDDFVQSLEVSEPNYKKELEGIYIPRSYPVRTGREKGKFAVAIPVLGVDPKTNEVVREYASYTDAENAGFDNIALIVSDKYPRYLSGGLRWFRKEDFNPSKIPPLPPQGNSVPVLCVERNQHFLSTRDAEEKMHKMGYRVNASKISAVLAGRRKHAGGFSWERSDLSYEAIMRQPKKAFMDASPMKAQNQKRAVLLQLISEPTIKKSFSSISEAARSIGSSTGNLIRAYKDGGSVKGFKVLRIG